MIITRTPVRLSILGGGSDFEPWFRQHGGIVIGGAIDKHSYITARFLPPFHDYKSRLVYREIETVNDVEDIKHKAIKEVLKYLDMGKANVEILHSADLPGRSGTGSSSTFVVGLLNALASLTGRRMLAHELTEAAITIEQERLGETVGCQDQTWAAHGGVNVIRFHRDGDINVAPLVIDQAHIEELESHLMLFFTKQERISSEVAKTYVSQLADRKREQFAMMRLAEDGIDAIYHKQWERLGWLVDQSWRIKAGLSTAVTNMAVNDMYSTARVAGAWGGKLTGAGGGGCLIVVAPVDKQPGIKSGLETLGAIHIPFRFDFNGSQVIFSDRSNIREYRPT